MGTAGDVNGDGYADVIVGAPLYDNGQTDEGRAFVYYGNAAGGLALRPQQRRADDSVPVAPGGQVISPTEARLAALAAHAVRPGRRRAAVGGQAGRDRVRRQRAGPERRGRTAARPAPA